jgi:hypothetical protein
MARLRTVVPQFYEYGQFLGGKECPEIAFSIAVRELRPATNCKIATKSSIGREGAGEGNWKNLGTFALSPRIGTKTMEVRSYHPPRDSQFLDRRNFLPITSSVREQGSTFPLHADKSSLGSLFIVTCKLG